MEEAVRTGSEPVTELKGIGPKSAAALQKLGIRTTGDLVRHYPARFAFYPSCSDLGDISEEGYAAVSASPVSPLTVIRRGRFVMTSGLLGDGTGELPVYWYNMPYLKKTIRSDEKHVFFGKVIRKGKKLSLEQPQVFSLKEYETLKERPVPVYPLTDGITNRLMTSAILQALERIPPIPDWLPESVRRKYSLSDLDQAVRGIHAPDSMEQFRKVRDRIVFDEFYHFLREVRKMKKLADASVSAFVMKTEDADREYRRFLPFRFTPGQEKSATEILADLSSGKIMNRLLQGDVGSGKTAVAAEALYAAFRNGWQSAIMVPTEVLARQHLSTLQKLFSGAPASPKLLLLTGSLKASEKKAAREMIRNHEADIIIGTHALIQDTVDFSCLSLVVTDEQHRFGVAQRGTLAEKGNHPHMLVMSATPIPRTLAVILYGDLDISTIEARPEGRIPIKNAVITKKDRPKAFLHIKKEIEKGHQAYIICPLVEENELLEEENVTDYSSALSETFRGITEVGCLHGKMKEAEKQRIMEDFAAGTIGILVSTTVVEVGVDVPNATVMMIENAERFGLASLHQLRGRVGRGKNQSYCIFVQGKKTKSGEERLKLLSGSNDGFEIAAADLKMRGPGSLFGLDQSGELTFGLGDIYNDYSVLKSAREVLDRYDLDEGESIGMQRNVIL